MPKPNAARLTKEQTQALRQLGLALRQLRRTRTGLPQDKFALKAKIDRTYYAKIEQGKVNASHLLLLRILKVLKLTWAELGAAIDAER